MSLSQIPVVTCDGCGLVAEGRDQPHLAALVGHLIGTGWRETYTSQQHFCPVCVGIGRVPEGVRLRPASTY